jgi:hypothetical protein
MIGRPIGFSGLAAATERPECSTAAGLLRYAFKNMTAARRRPSPWAKFIKIIGGR